jgi:hypothetical protein
MKKILKATKLKKMESLTQLRQGRVADSAWQRMISTEKTQLEPQSNKSVKFDGDYVEMQWNRSTVERYISLLKLKKEPKIHAF